LDLLLHTGPVDTQPHILCFATSLDRAQKHIAVTLETNNSKFRYNGTNKVTCSQHEKEMFFPLGNMLKIAGLVAGIETGTGGITVIKVF